MWKSLLLFSSLFLSVSVANASSCKIKSDHILYLKGDTDAKMLACVEKLDLSSIDTVRLKSRGGSVEHAMQIGDLIAPLHAEMIVKDYCNSSCANYFLPLASSVYVEAGAELMLHGSFDPGIIRRAEPEHRPKMWKLIDRQFDYAERHVIHRGWLLYRTKYEKRGGEQYLYIDGDFGWLDRDDPVGFMQVKTQFFESCFPDIPIVFESPTMIELANSDEKLRDKLLKQGLRPTGHWTCKGPYDPNWPVPSEEERQTINNE